MKKLIKDPVAVACLLLIALVAAMGFFSLLFAPNDPLEQDILNKFASAFRQNPLGTDNLGRCVYSRLVYGIRTTVFLLLGDSLRDALDPKEEE